MTTHIPESPPTDGGSTSIEIADQTRRFSLAGPALAVVAIIALLGMILVCVKLIELSEKAIIPQHSSPIQDPELSQTRRTYPSPLESPRTLGDWCWFSC